jgi:hypothetical protein
MQHSRCSSKSTTKRRPQPVSNVHVRNRLEPVEADVACGQQPGHGSDESAERVHRVGAGNGGGSRPHAGRPPSFMHRSSAKRIVSRRETIEPGGQARVARSSARHRLTD